MRVKCVGKMGGSRVSHVETTALETSDHLNQDKIDFNAMCNLFCSFFCLCFVGMLTHFNL